MSNPELTQFNGRRFSLLLFDDTGEQVVYGGWTAQATAESLILHRPESMPFEIRTEWVERIKAVPNEEVAKILKNAEFFLYLSVGPILEASDEEGMFPTGLKWPS